ncbi:MAG TPA: hypothetical protein PKD53_27405 [Chloroflexaceae bacterium]|nr:hypothetical protein [Chloroflexaceae bacterium]
MQRMNVIALFLALVALLAAAPAAYAGLAERGRTETLTFEVAEDMTRFVFDQDVVYDDGLPADGSAFITRGYLYEPGTLTCDAEGSCDGVNADGSAQFPDRVVGEWICSGYMINDAGHATGGVWVFSTQFFQLGDQPGAQTVVSQGYELADLGVAISRAITGGTGAYADARGQGQQTMLGLNASEGVTLRVQLDVRTR